MCERREIPCLAAGLFVDNLICMFCSSITISFSKLGYKDVDGEWTDLLKGVMNEEVDLALDSVVKTQERYTDMVFTHNIMNSMRNIYIKPQESNELRDIFLVPFGSRLIICVIATGVIFVLVVAVVSGISGNMHENMNEQNRNVGILEATVWCVAVFTMQGSFWHPRTYSGNIVVILSLAFALLIYNSYSAFITSVLSVEVTDIRSVNDLLESDYEIGYTKNSQDEVYLRLMNITQLKKIYLRGYLHNSITNVTDGLLKATKGNYGFFASVHIARKELLNITNYKCIFNIMEIPVKSTSNTIAFPMSKRSPYRKIINLCIMKMYESGIHKYIHSQIVPDLPKCEKSRTYRTAHLPDLMTAFGILLFGIMLGLFLMILECLWIRKRKIYLHIRKRLTQKKSFMSQCHDTKYQADVVYLE